MSPATLKARLRGVVDTGASLVGRLQVQMVCRATGSAPLVVLDIDNTIADSWPSFLTSWPNQRRRLAGLDVLPNIKAIAHDEAIAAGASVLFLSHRNPWEWPVTYRWLRRHGFAATWRNVVLVGRPQDKVRHLARCARGRTVTVWDDLTFGHETGTVTEYVDVIASVRTLDVAYRGWDDIVAITGRTADRQGAREST